MSIFSNEHKKTGLDPQRSIFYLINPVHRNGGISHSECPNEKLVAFLRPSGKIIKKHLGKLYPHLILTSIFCCNPVKNMIADLAMSR